MCRSHFKYLVFILLFQLQSLAFELKPFVTAPSTSEQIQIGLRGLFQNNINDAQLSELTTKSLQFQSFVYQTLNQQIAQNRNIEVHATEKTMGGNFVKETTVRFKSLIQRPSPHAANEVVARIYEPSVQRRFCEYQYPTTILLHHILNQVPMIEDVGKVMASGVLGQPAIVVVLHMPHYGDRRQGEEDFLTTDADDFKMNMAQLILDVHMLKNYLATKKNVDPSRVSLSGISLGAVVGLTVGAFDQSFASYGSLVGGADMANILINRARRSPESEVGMILQKVKLNEDQLRANLAPIDAMTWAHRYQSKKFFFISAQRDDIVDYDQSVKPFVSQLESQHNQLQKIINDDGHSPSGSAIKKLKEVFLPLLQFVVSGAPTMEVVCPTN